MGSIYGTDISYGQGLGQSLGTQAATNALNFPFSVAGNLLNYHLQEKAADRADARQRAQFRDMYSIQAQMKQLKEAGLSPSLMYGGTPSQGGATAPQGHGAYGTQALATISPMEVAQVQKTDAEKRLIEEEIKNKNADTTNKEIRNYIDYLTKDIAVEERTQNLQVLVALGTKYLSESDLNIAKKANTNWQTTWEQIKSNEELNLLRNQNALYLAQIATEDTKQGLNEQQTKTLTAQIDKWQMDVTQKYYELDIMSWNQEAQENWWKAQADNLTNRLEFDAKKVNLELDFGKKKMWVDNVFDVGKTAIIGAGMIFTRGSINLSTPNVTYGKPNPIGFK